MMVHANDGAFLHFLIVRFVETTSFNYFIQMELNFHKINSFGLSVVGGAARSPN
jgi:hypothetical protein